MKELTSDATSCQINSVSGLNSEQQLALVGFVGGNDIFAVYCSVEAPPVLYFDCDFCQKCWPGIDTLIYFLEEKIEKCCNQVWT